MFWILWATWSLCSFTESIISSNNCWIWEVGISDWACWTVCCNCWTSGGWGTCWGTCCCGCWAFCCWACCLICSIACWTCSLGTWLFWSCLPNKSSMISLTALSASSIISFILILYFFLHYLYFLFLINNQIIKIYKY